MDAEEFPFGRDYWEDRYGAVELTWSGNPNPALVAEATGLSPGRALDIGSGEGGDALWLATQGWTVTGVDIAHNALAKARRQTESVNPAAAERIDWQQHDLTTWAPDERSYDLVSSQFMQLPETSRTTLFRVLALAVAPGGTLLIVGHDVFNIDSSEHRAHFRELMFGVDDVLAAIDGEHLNIEVAEVRARPHGETHTGSGFTKDVVVRATRRQ